MCSSVDQIICGQKPLWNSLTNFQPTCSHHKFVACSATPETLGSSQHLLLDQLRVWTGEWSLSSTHCASEVWARGIWGVQHNIHISCMAGSVFPHTMCHECSWTFTADMRCPFWWWVPLVQHSYNSNKEISGSQHMGSLEWPQGGGEERGWEVTGDSNPPEPFPDNLSYLRQQAKHGERHSTLRKKEG